MKPTDSFKRMLDALAHANAGENLTLRQKAAHLGSNAIATAQAVLSKPAAGSQVGLYLGINLPEDVMQYVMQTCNRLKHGLTVLTFQSESDAEVLLAPYHNELSAAGIEMRLVALSGEPLAPLAQALRRRPEVAFLVCNESGYLGNGLLTGRVRKDALPVPVVLVTSEGSATQTIRHDEGTVNRVA
jgi:hypothetical protein